MKGVRKVEVNVENFLELLTSLELTVKAIEALPLDKLSPDNALKEVLATAKEAVRNLEKIKAEWESRPEPGRD